jgi:glycosyltransferase involved in cell wall biosynthesis
MNTSEPSIPARPAVAIIVPLMDRAMDLAMSLPSFLSQDYPNYHIYVVDHSSTDDVDASLAGSPSSRLTVIRCPRPVFFNRSKARNTGARYASHSSLLLFLDADSTFQDQRHLSMIVQDFFCAKDIDNDYWSRARQAYGFKKVTPRNLPNVDVKMRRVYCHTSWAFGTLLVERSAFEQVGGYNEFLDNWGYEDGDILARLELCRFGRIAIEGIVNRRLPASDSVAFHRIKDKVFSWHRNRWLSDRFISTYGVVPPGPSHPGRWEWIMVNGVWHDGAQVSQQSWEIRRRAGVALHVFVWRAQFKSWWIVSRAGAVILHYARPRRRWRTLMSRIKGSIRKPGFGK